MGALKKPKLALLDDADDPHRRRRRQRRGRPTGATSLSTASCWAWPERRLRMRDRRRRSAAAAALPGLRGGVRPPGGWSGDDRPGGCARRVTGRRPRRAGRGPFAALPQPRRPGRRPAPRLSGTSSPCSRSNTRPRGAGTSKTTRKNRSPRPSSSPCFRARRIGSLGRPSSSSTRLPRRRPCSSVTPRTCGTALNRSRNVCCGHLRYSRRVLDHERADLRSRAEAVRRMLHILHRNHRHARSTGSFTTANLRADEQRREQCAEPSRAWAVASALTGENATTRTRDSACRERYADKRAAPTRATAMLEKNFASTPCRPGILVSASDRRNPPRARRSMPRGERRPASNKLCTAICARRGADRLPHADSRTPCGARGREIRVVHARDAEHEAAEQDSAAVNYKPVSKKSSVPLKQPGRPAPRRNGRRCCRGISAGTWRVSEIVELRGQLVGRHTAPEAGK